MQGSEIIKVVETLGFPVFIAIALMGGIYLLGRWMMNTLMHKMDAQWNMITKLIDRTRALDNSIIRLETMIRLLNHIDPDWERLGKLDDEDKRKD